MKGLSISRQSAFNADKLSHFLHLGLQYQSKISFVCTFLLLAASAWILGVVAWQLFPQSQSMSRWTPPVVTASSGQLSATIDSEDINKAHIFGLYNKEQTIIQAPVVSDAPKSRLNVVLVGSVVSSNPKLSLAVVANRGQQATYGIGEQIEGTRATINAVLIDRIIISNAGRDETVMLEGLDYKKLEVPEPAQRSGSNVRGNNADAAEASTDDLAEIRQAITEDPQQIFQYVRLSQVKKAGKILGYRVSPGKKPQLFNSVGLQNGDIATELNGQDLTDPSSMGEIFKSINDLTELNLTVERDGQQHDIFIQF